MADYGYDISDYCDVDPVFGTLDRFQGAAGTGARAGPESDHRSGLCPYFRSPPRFIESRSEPRGPGADWFVWADAKPDGSPPSNWQSVFYGPAWTWDARRKQYYMHNFLPEQPQLNVHNKEVQQALLDVAQFWLDLESMASGSTRSIAPFITLRSRTTRPEPTLRPRVRTNSSVRSTICPSPNWCRSYAGCGTCSTAIDARFTVAEIGGDNPAKEMQRITAGDDLLHTAYNFEFLDGPQITPAYVAKVMARWPEGTWPSWAFSNHDAMRIVSRCAKGRDPTAFAKPMLLLLQSLRGNAFVYYGEELGMHHGDIPFERLLDPEAIRNWPETKCRDGARTPMVWNDAEPFASFGNSEPWLPIDPRHYAQSVEAQEADAQSVLHFARTAIGFRRNSKALRLGDFTLRKADHSLLVFTRRCEDETLLCLFNLGPVTGHFTLPQEAEEIVSLGNPLPDRGGVAGAVRFHRSHLMQSGATGANRLIGAVEAGGTKFVLALARDDGACWPNPHRDAHP